MEIKVNAPCDATCSAIFVTLGDVLDVDSWMATLVPS